MITVVIADRMGKGQNVGKGVEKAGGRAIVVPGIGADMQLGIVMDREKADFGISFCGSGGAGALAAQNGFGYKAKYGMRSTQEGIVALNDNVKALGFGFNDVEELGYELAKEYMRLQENGKN